MATSTSRSQKLPTLVFVNNGKGSFRVSVNTLEGQLIIDIEGRELVDL